MTFYLCFSFCELSVHMLCSCSYQLIILFLSISRSYLHIWEISPLRYASQLFIQFIIGILTLLVVFSIMQKFAHVCFQCVCSQCVCKVEFINIFIMTSGLWILPVFYELRVPSGNEVVAEGKLSFMEVFHLINRKGMIETECHLCKP